MSANVEPIEEKQNENMLTITEDERDAKETSLGDTKIKLDLDEDCTYDTSQDTFVEKVAKEVSSVILEESGRMDNRMESEEKKFPEVSVIEDKPDHSLDEKSNIAEEDSKSKLGTKYMWVSNIGRNISANHLKKYFGKYGKVQTAKILTNGKSFYGYISMETVEQASRCIKELNNSVFEGCMINVSRNRPEMKKVLSENIPAKTKSRVHEKSHEKIKSVVKKTEEKESQSKVEEKKEKHETVTSRSEKDQKIIPDLERRLKNAHADISRFKRKLDECERKNLLLERNSRKEIDKIRSERRRLNRDKENFEKIKKDFQKQMSADKASVIKELDEVKALRVKLQNKLDTFLTNTPRVNRKSRSPLTRSNRSVMENELISEERRFREREREARNPKRTRRNSATARISPPSPPILTDFDRRVSQRNEHFASNRPYYSDERKHVNFEKPFDFRQKQNVDNQSRDNRNSYPMSLVQPFVRYGNTVQNNLPIFSQSRTGYNQYAPEYGKQYNHY